MLASTALLVLIVAAVARAQESVAENPPYDAGVACQEATGQDIGCDTEYTPVAKDAPEGWHHIGGALFGKEGELVDGSPAPATVDFYTVRFPGQNPDVGFAGGAACPDGTPFDQLHADYCGPSRSEGVPRVPVIYRYLDPDGPAGDQPWKWEEVYRGSNKGYVGAIAFTDQAGTGAIAVGGTGSYPRRELKRGPTEDDAAYLARDLAGAEPNASGRGRVWTYNDGDWGEFLDTPLTEQQDPMRGLSAVACSPRLTDGGRCLAGGLRQLWVWQGEGFTKSFTDRSPRSDLDPAGAFLYRVRDVEFVAGSQTPDIQAVAITAGCCTGNPATDHANVIGFDGQHVNLRPGMEMPRRSESTSSGALTPVTEASLDAAYGNRPRDSLAESYYSVFVAPAMPEIALGPRLSVVASPGGPAPEPVAAGTSGPPEPPSRIFGPVATNGLSQTDVQDVTSGYGVTAIVQGPSLASEAASPTLGTIRLVAGDGDFAGPQLSTSLTQQEVGPDGTIDWAVGELTSTGQAVAFTTVPAPTPFMDAADCPNGSKVATDTTAAQQTAKCQPRSTDDVTGGTRSRRLFEFPTYALNGFVFVPGSSNAWAVGDRGALISYGGKGAATAGAEPAPPRLGTPREGGLPDDSPYDGLKPEPQGPVGSVPSASLQPERRLDEPRFIPAGSPDPVPPNKAPREDVTEIVMSRDGGEGWALGGEDRTSSNNPGTTLFHFINGRWTRCSTDAVGDVVKPDPACRELAPLRNAQEKGRPAPTPIPVAARVPLERDDDPANDDEFEVVAVAGRVVLPGDEQPTAQFLRYRDGRWAIDQQMTEAFATPTDNNKASELVFVAPDDGWLLVTGQGPKLFHWDGESWHDCVTEPAACDAPAGLFPPGYGFAVSDQADLVEAGGRVYVAMSRIAGGNTLSQITYPMVAYKDPGGTWSVDRAGGGLDPGCESGGGTSCVASGETEEQGKVVALSVVPAPGGGFTGWMAGSFGGSAGLVPAVDLSSPEDPIVQLSPMMRLESTGGAGWALWSDQTLSNYAPRVAEGVRLLTTPEGIGDNEAWLTPAAPSPSVPAFPLLAFRDGRWHLAGSPFSTIVRDGHGDVDGSLVPQAMAPDGEGGFWLAGKQAGSPITERGAQIGFHHYTDRMRDPVFEDAPHPIREPIAATAGGADGSLWVATETSAVYRYDRHTGWDRVAVPGWDPGRVVTRPSEATAIAVGDDGEGLVVGRQGRIAELSAVGAHLDPSAGSVLCGEQAPTGACGTGRTLRAVAIAPDGSALAAGDGRTIMWRPLGEEFRTVAPPPTAESARITGVSLPQPDRAYLVTDFGQVWAGQLAGSDWSWSLENRSGGRLLSIDDSGNPVQLNAISLDRNEHGYAVGDKGLVLRRTGDPDEPWHRLDLGIREDLYSVTQPATGEGGSALIGGFNGAIYTGSGDRFEPARIGNLWDPLTAAPAVSNEAARITGLAMLPGPQPGSVEAWAATTFPRDASYIRQPRPQALLRYTSDGADPAEQVDPLPDTAPERDGELTLAALGRTDCGRPTDACPEAQNSEFFTDIVTRRIAEQLAERRRSAESPLTAVFTGDTTIASGSGNPVGTPVEADVTEPAWVEFVAGGFADADVPLYGAVGLRDLTRAKYCSAGCVGTAQAGIGTSTPWRDAMAGMPSPWGREPALSEGSVSYVPVTAGTGIEHPDGAIPDPAHQIPGEGGPGAHTHYALDLERDGQRLLRLVFADNSLRSLNASEPNQNPVELGGQDAWLDAVLCRTGEGTGCTRAAGEPAVVVANTPSYSYGPGTLEHTASDAATFEQKLLQHDVSALIAGRLGWNALYYTCAPQLHTPQPGGEYPRRAPETVEDCSGGAGGEQPLEPPDPNELLGNLGGTGLLPSVIAASAGGEFGPNRDESSGSARDGFWHGYTLVRVPASGDPAGVIVEQRPIFDWLGIRPAPGAPATHVVRASRKVALEGFGREPVGTDTSPRYDEITSAAITHRYDLLVADPEKPWLPLEADDDGERTAASTRVGESDPCGPYLCLPGKVGTIDDQTGQVKAGKGNYPRTFAIAALSVGDKVATYPLVFEPRASFSPPAPVPVRPPALPPAPANPAQPPQPGAPTVEALVPPVLPTLTAAQPPAPPVPPTPPPAESQAPLDLNLAPTALDVTPPTAVSQPPTPPVNPAPPSGARREARQRQAAAQKSGADAEESAGDEGTGDLAKAPDSHDAAMTRHDFTAVADRRQPSAWARDALIGGGIGVAALILALGLRTARPTPRRREPELPAPAWSRSRRRW